MPDKKLVDVSKLQEGTVIYDKALRTLPYATLEEVAQTLALNVMDIQGKHARINERRAAGGTQSYVVGKEFEGFKSILGYEPSIIEPKDVVFITKENSKKYADNELLIVGGKPVDNINKKHPLETRLLFALVISHIEDVVYSLFHAERDDTSKTPQGAFDGYFTKADALIASGAVSAEKGNLVTTGEFTMPATADDTAAYDNLVKFVGAGHPQLRSSHGGVPQLIISETVIKAARAALRNKLKQIEYPTVQRMMECLREDAFCPTLELATHEALGQGSRAILQKKGNFDLAINTKSASKFCQVRDIYEDPNEWQFWLQCGYDTRINDWHEKVFLCNEQKNTPIELSGDYKVADGAVAQQ